MSQKLSFCVRAAKSLDDQDLSAITDGIENYMRAGMSAEQAESAAVGDMIAAVTAERGDMVKTLRTQHPDLFLSSRPPLPEPKKARARVQPIRGSMALGQISVQLDGLSPDLLPDLSSKVERTRVSKTGKRSQYTTWDNPPQPGVGPLFRKGGTADLSEVARVLEEEGYMEPGTIEADPIGATQRAQAIVKAELAKGGSTVRIGAPEEVEAEMQRRQDMANELPDDVFDGIDDDAFEQSGYADLPPEVKALTEQLLAQAEAAGLDTETMRERAAMGDPTDADYHAQLDALLTEALASAAAGTEEHDASAAPGGRESGRQPAEGEEPGAGPAGRDAGRAEPGGLSYGGTVQEPGASYTTDLFGTDLEGAGATQLPTQRAAAPTPAPAPAPTATPTEGALNDTPAPEGNYQARTIVGSEIQRTLGAARITTPAEAAAATQYLYRNAVERLDGIVVDKNGKPLAVVGGFKGALAQASIYPSTLVGEAVRVPGAAAIWFSHNHPSGSAQLSNADKHLNQMLADVFRGSGIEPKGLLAIGDGRYHYVDEGGKEAAPWTITKLTTTSKVPAIERQLAGTKEKTVELTSPLQAKTMAKKMYEAGGNRPGLLLTDSQLNVVAWVPLPEVTHGKLRGTGGLKAIYRAVSEANAGAAFIVHGGELDGPVGTRANSSQNIAAALKAIDVRPIDSINVQTGKSAAETGERIDASTMLDLADNGTTDTPAFKAWFGDSKVVDAQGKPLVVYHGTKAEFTEFKRTKSGEFGPAIYLTDSAREAGEYGDGKGWGGPSGTAVMPVYVSIKNPYTNGVDAFWKEFGGADSDAAALDRAQAAGYDGIIAKREDRYYDNAAREFVDRGETLTHYIAFRPEQIKSATGNAGTFDPNNPDIRQDFQDTQQLERPEVTEGAPAQQDVDAVAKIQARMRAYSPAFQSLTMTPLPRRAAPGKNASEAEKQRYAAADLAEKLFGKRVVFFTSNMQFANGLMASYFPDVVFINESTTRPIMAVLGHELLHSMRQSNPALYERLHDRLRGMLEEPGRYHEQLNRRREARGMDPLSFDKLREELLADIVGDNFTDPAFWRQMTAGQPTLFGRVLRVIRDFLDDLLAKLRNERPYGTNQYLNDVQAARDAVAAAMREFGNDPKTAAAAVTTAAGADLSTSNDQTGTTAFRKWFGDSKVVNDDGTPRVVYHGTGQAMLGDAFSPDLAKSEGGAFYFSHSPLMKNPATNANDYAKNRSGDAPNVMPVYLRMTNPLIVGFTEPMPEGDKAITAWLGRMQAFNRSIDMTKEQYYKRAIREARAAGHDGVIVRNVEDVANDAGRRFTDEADVYIALKPEQIKSAIGNSGAFDSSNPDIRMDQDDGGAPPTDDDGLPMFSLQHTPEEEAALAKAGINTRTRLQRAGDRIRQHYTTAQNALRSDWAAGFQQGALDQFTGINRAIKREIGALPRDQDPYVAARLANGGTSSVMRGLMLHGQARWAANGQHLEKIPDTEGLLDILKPLGPRLNDFFGWMIGNRAERLMKEGRENNFTADDIKALKGLNKGMESEFRAAALKYAAFKRTVLDVAEQAGLLDPESRKVWDNADYIPFYREIDDKAVFSATGKKGLSGQSSGIRTLKGGEAALNDPMENILMNFSRLIDASLKNRALKKTIDVLMENKSDIISKVGRSAPHENTTGAQIKQQLQQAGTPEQILAVIPPETFEAMAKMQSAQETVKPGMVRVMHNGQQQLYQVHDPLLLKALTSFVPFDFPGLGVARAFKRVLTGMVTVTPDFMLRNWIRDTAATAIITRDGFNPMKSLSGVVKSYREAGAFEDLLFAGASFQSGHINAADPVQTGKAMRRALREKGFDASSTSAFIGSILDTPMRFFEKYKHVGESIENGNREAVYEAARTAGKSPTAAAFESKDLMDFSLRGSNPFYQLLADVLPFFNARVQGLYRLGRADPKRVALYGTLMMVATLALAYANGDNDDYDKLPDWDKETYWHFWIKGEHFRMPKPFELGAVFASIPERIMRYAMGQDTGKKTLSRIWAIARDQLAFDPVPQLIRPVMNTWANKDTFRDRPIENQGDEGKLPSMRYSKVTSPTAVTAVKAIAPVADEIGLSPKKLEYLVGGYLGTAGLYALGLSDMAVSKLRGDPVKPATRLDQLPIIGSFYRQEPATSTVYETDLYKMRTEVEQIYKSVRALKKDDKDDEAEALAAKHEKELDARKTLERGAKKLTSLNKQRDEIYADRTMTREEKRKAIDELLRDRAEISKDTMKSEEVINAQ